VGFDRSIMFYEIIPPFGSTLHELNSYLKTRQYRPVIGTEYYDRFKKILKKQKNMQSQGLLFY